MEVSPSNGRSMPCPHRTRSMQCPPRCGTCPQYVIQGGPRKVKSKLCQQNLKQKKKVRVSQGHIRGLSNMTPWACQKQISKGCLMNIRSMRCAVRCKWFCIVNVQVCVCASAFGSLLSLGLSGRTERSITKFCCKWFLGSRCRRLIMLIMLILANCALSNAARVFVWGPHIQGCQQSRYF